ncbi:MAG TPA: CopG family antitoxin [Micropepsaceae bacterium]|nr:CopG family antitoxin [Micropepsaceae bacterium]
MKRKVPKLASDNQAEAFLEQDLSNLDFSQFKPVQFEFEKKTARVNMRLPQPLLDAVKKRASARRIPYQRFIREALERAVASRNRHDRVTVRSVRYREGFVRTVEQCENMEAVEVVRARYRPRRITTLFVGESAPHSGNFFYCGNTIMLRQMKRAVEQTLGESDDFLTTFKAYGWYLDDLVLTPVNHLTRSERKAKCLEAQNSLADRIAEYQPRAIVSLLLGIEKIVNAAAIAAGSGVHPFAVPFPGMGHQAKFQTAMAKIIPKLPKD